jgi:hypothetical protein
MDAISWRRLTSIVKSDLLSQETGTGTRANRLYIALQPAQKNSKAPSPEHEPNNSRP